MDFKMRKSVADFYWAVGLNRVSLRLMGVWPDYFEEDPKSFVTISTIPFMILVIMSCVFVPQMYAMSKVGRQLALVVDNLMSSCPAFIGCLKLYFLWKNKEG